MAYGYNGEKTLDENKEEAENYYRIHHVWPAWYTHTYHTYGWNGEEANKGEEDNYYLRHHTYAGRYGPHGVYRPSPYPYGWYDNK